MLNASDILDGARTSDPAVFVVGAYDDRITFFSQQVRGLELVHALKDQGLLRARLRCAVVGGGAAGVAAAAALALIEDVDVILYEAAADVMMLQSASNHRRLDPYIYDWPGHNTADEVAGLPILDWRSGSARRVWDQVQTEFTAIRGAVGGRLSVLTRHKVENVRREAGGLRVQFRAPNTGVDPEHDAFDLVILAFGFGLETVGGDLQSTRYWDDAGVPGPEFTARETPRFLVSGNGDGALIDLVAAASRDFSHTAMLQTIIDQPRIGEVMARISEIDRAARAAAARGEPVNYADLYDAQLYSDLVEIGLVARIERELRANVHVIWQTLEPDPYTVKTATVNRLAAYLVSKAIGVRFQHRAGALSACARPAAGDPDLPRWFNCAGEVVGVHTAVIRHGPDRVAVRTPFDNLLADFAAEHERWLARFGEAALAPRLSPAARQTIEAAALRWGVPAAVWRAEEIQNALPTRIAVQRDGARLAWSGDLPLDDCARLWDDPGPRGVAYASLTPAEMPASAAALLRLCAHSPALELKGDAAVWRAYSRDLTTDSPHGRDFAGPQISAGQPEGVAQNVTPLNDGQLALRIHGALDAWMLAKIDDVLSYYIRTGVDRGTQITLDAAGDLRAAMQPVWLEWKQMFEADPALLARFLRLMICAKDTVETTPEALLLMGPRKLTNIIRATAVTVMVAAGWTQASPSQGARGNLAVQRAAGHWSGHACGAEMIDRRLMSIQAGRFVWTTHFVVLPLVDQVVQVSRLAETTLADTGGELSLRDAGQPSFMVTTDDGFRDAAEAGLEPLRAFLAGAETRHFDKLRKDLELVP